MLSIKFLCVTLPHMSICTGVIVAVVFQQIEYSPDAQTGTESNHQRTQNIDCRIEKYGLQ